nr:hypothetical protein [Tanacetum cinerariifolium]
MSKKEKDPEVIAKKISHKPIDYEKLNRLTDDFRKRFTPQQELSAEQAFWLRISNPTIEFSLPPVRVEVPSELPKNDLKAQLKDKDTTICKLKDTIISLRKNNKEEIVDHDRCDLATINEELENNVAQLLSKNERLYKEIEVIDKQLVELLMEQLRFDDSCETEIVIHKTASDSYYCQYKISAIQIVSAASIVVNTVSMQTSGSGISNLLAVATTFTGSGNLYCQWECLVYFIPNNPPLNLMLLLHSSFPE